MTSRPSVRSRSREAAAALHQRHTEKPGGLLERDFQRQVIALAKLQGWKCYHTHDSRKSQPGFPDLVLVRKGRIIFAELKKNGAKATPEQLKWLYALNGAQAVSKVWWPMDFPLIEKELGSGNQDRS